MTDPASIAAGLTKASKRAIVRMNSKTWVGEGGHGPAGKDAYSLWWGKDGRHHLVEEPIPYAINQFGCSWKWRLTPLGLAVRAALHDDTVRGEGEHAADQSETGDCR